MSETSKRLNEALCTYITETLGHIETVGTFCKTFPKWMEARKTELEKLNKMLSPESKHAELEKELDEVLKNTLDGLEKLDLFLDAVEKLAVTSLNVFTQNQVVQLSKHSEHVQIVIIHAKLICPLLLEFKRDAKVFFLPKLQNLEVLKYQFDTYVQVSKMICDRFEKSISAFPLMMNEVQVDINMDLPESDIQDMLCRINQLNEIRMDTNFRMVFLFQEKSCSDFIKVVQNRQPRMLKFLEDLEQCAVQLDRMNKGAKISSITGSSVGAVGGVLSIVGLALSPVTAGASLGLLLGGTAMGILSGTNSAVTTFTEIGVNHKQRNKANDVLQKFMEDVQSIHDCLGEVINQPTADKEVLLVFL
uniref:Apolipoprotein L n=1 Tax=Oreochromis niloticus TaxID=8128 RepID=I3JTM3_ORENI